MPNKCLAIDDMLTLSRDDDSKIRLIAATALNSILPEIPDKDQLWMDLMRLAKDSQRRIRFAAILALGSAYPYISSKDAAWKDLIGLAHNTDSRESPAIYHSLGRASVLNATESKEKDQFKNCLQLAVEYFRRSSSGYYGCLGKFCYTFYRSYIAIIFENASDEEVFNYLDDARKSVERSIVKEDFVEVIENLAKAMLESRKIKLRAATPP
ncbi:MAG: hypothetical protein QG575_809 [Euryarchaeota archaeon]|nr:hypothetical protein [Euryarchaeota archaeon]